MPTFNAALTQTNCFPSPLPSEFAQETPVGPLVYHPATHYTPIWTPVANLTDFEHLGKYPHFPRIAIWYDSLPARVGAIWKHFPRYGQWDSIASAGHIRNMKGHETAIAYREHGGEPYNYAVLSYDERGRVEALLHYTDNLGFDAVYYTYNSANKVTSVRVADPLRQYTTWYSYDFNGRVDSVGSALSSAGNGLGVTASQYPAPQTRPQDPDMSYSYTKANQVDTMRYSIAGQPFVDVAYRYSNRKWLDSMVATTQNGSQKIFRQALHYDPTGQITRQRWTHGMMPEQTQYYTYDPMQRLTAWGNGGVDSTNYTYDAVGNRSGEIIMGTQAANRTYMYGGSVGGSNRLNTVIRNAAQTQWTTYRYNANGSTVGRDQWAGSYTGLGGITGTEDFTYSYRELLRGYVNGSNDWRYTRLFVLS